MCEWPDWHGDLVHCADLHAYTPLDAPDVPSDPEIGVTTTDDGGWGLDNTMGAQYGSEH